MQKQKIYWSLTFTYFVSILLLWYSIFQSFLHSILIFEGKTLFCPLQTKCSFFAAPDSNTILIQPKWRVTRFFICTRIITRRSNVDGFSSHISHQSFSSLTVTPSRLLLGCRRLEPTVFCLNFSISRCHKKRKRGRKKLFFIHAYIYTF